MDQMDIDQIVEVPDTPDRLSKQGINGRRGVKVENPRSSLSFHGQQKLFEEGSRDQPMVIDSGSRGRPLHPPKRANSPSNSRHPTTSASLPLASSSSSRNSHLFQKGVTENNPIYLNHDQHLQSMRPPLISKSTTSSQNNGFLDLTEMDLHKPVTENASSSRVPGNHRGDFRKRLGLTNLPTASSNACDETKNVSRIGPNIAIGERVDFVDNDNKRLGNGDFLSRDPIASPRNKQKRLVRNGCISPNNIAKAKQLAGEDINVSAAVTHNNSSMASSAIPISTDIRELVAEESDSRTRRGKGVISHFCSSKGPDLHNKNSHCRSSMSSSEKAMETMDYSKVASKSTEESAGWRSTRNQTREINLSSHDKEHRLIRERDGPRYSSQHHENRHPRARLGRLNGPRSAADSLIKRQKQGSTSNSRGECSTSVSDDPEVVFLSSSADADNSRSTSSNVNNSQQIIEVDEVSPPCMRNAPDEDARARQVEADELVARELQEQLYNEVPVFGFGEVDQHIALALRHQDASSHGSSRARHPILDARLLSNLHRQSQSRSSSNAPRRGALARASTLGRMTRLRSRFPGQPRTLLPSRARTSMFPPDMDVDTRMQILGALEEFSFSNMGMNTGILQANRDFTEDDYEMLLALDENNDQHGGASIHQINGLPQSTVQSDNFEEACAVCLETPTIGETIRHLPCLHKFHKDCIDPWLRRRTSCPVCKSSIT